MKNIKTSIALAASAVAMCASTGALAQQAGAWQVGTGWLHFSPQDSSGPLTFTSPVNRQVPGSGAGVGNADTLGFNATYFFDSHWAGEAVVGVPPKFNLYGEGSLGRLGKLGEARQYSPTLLAKYYFNEGSAQFRPFVGFGATYVFYRSVKLTQGLQGAIAGQIGAPSALSSTSAKLDSSFAPVFNVGAAYQFDKHWGMSFSVSYIPLKTTAKLTTSVRGNVVATSEARIKLNPIVPYLALTYTF
ncbi:OmpW/AlkL family protein [Variovorax ginsengisoli]|uniref:Outer membrane protein n=1 Tax=Variovorax ginsengisoli TaxID=363844 RepID=A0ABT9S216_9BURK|nr:OmpW family outer membrane protein [Variovorax ginsengisoli]MDP9898391.1 outer membrane protein [Variovorax ginsengisoli]